MWGGKSHSASKKGPGNGLVAVAIDKDKGSQHALRWAAENLLSKGETVILIHVAKSSADANHDHGPPDETTLTTSNKQLLEKLSKELFLSFHCYCTRKEIHCLDIVLEEADIIKALTDYIGYAAIEKLVLGAPSRGGFMRKFRADVPSSVLKAAQDFCHVYVINKGKVQTERRASHSASLNSPLLAQVQKQNSFNKKSELLRQPSTRGADQRLSFNYHGMNDHYDSGPLQNGRKSNAGTKSFGDFSDTDTDMSFTSFGRPSTDWNSSLYFDSFMDSGLSSQMSNCTGYSLGSESLGYKWNDQQCTSQNYSAMPSHESGISSSSSSQNWDEVEGEMKKLRLELKLAMDLYSNACKEALSAKQQAMEVHRYEDQENERVEEADIAAEAAMSAAEKARSKCKSVVRAVEATQRIAEADPFTRKNIEGEVVKEIVEIKKILATLSRSNIKYRKYSFKEIEKATDGFSSSRQIGGGGYGPVYKCYLDHTPVAVKVLQPNAAQGRLQFLQEIEVLSCIRHPNVVLLLGACPEHRILVNEYMAKGSLDDRLFRRGNTPALSWQLRFRIAAEIATGLLFLHQTKPKAILHRDFKPGNILLDQNYVSKISDVGLATLVPDVADNATDCEAAGTFCYIDPEYQQTGEFGVKSDVYSLGIVLLQLITAKPPMGLAHNVEQAIEKGTFLTDMVDHNVPDWPAEETLSIAKMSLRCTELKRKDRPDLDKEILSELSRFRDMAEGERNQFFFSDSARSSFCDTHVSSSNEIKIDIDQETDFL